MNKYQQLQRESQEQKDEHELQAQSEVAELQLGMDISETKLALSKAKQKLQKQLQAKTFSSKLVIAAQLEVEEFEAGLKRLKDLQTEFFTQLPEGQK